MTCGDSSSSSYTWVETTNVGDTSAGCAPVVYVMKTNSGYDSDRNSCANAIDTMLSDVYNGGSGYIPGYQINEYDIDLDLNCSKGLLKQLECWRNQHDNGFNEAAAYVAVHRCNKGGASSGANAWDKPADCHGSAHPDRNLERSTTHEVLHSFIIHDKCDKVSGLTPSDGVEHDLGNARSINGDRKFTPFAREYRAERGDCSVSDADSSWPDTLKASSCSKKAMRYSANHTLNGHYDNAC